MVLDKFYNLLDKVSLKNKYYLKYQIKKIHNKLNSNLNIDKELSNLKNKFEKSILEQKIKQDKFNILKSKIDYEDLPISQKVSLIKKEIENNQVTIIVGETGSGKSTQIPKICLDLDLGLKGKIVHTQPRRIAARSIANRLSEELQTNLGEEVGFKIRFMDKTNNNSFIKVVTDGVLLKETQSDKYLLEYDTIIIDEAHERSLNIDFLLGYLKKLLEKRKDLKVIITSATINYEKFAKHFNASIIKVSGRTYKVDIKYRDYNEENKILGVENTNLSQEEKIELAILELSLYRKGDILVFLATEKEIRDTFSHLQKSSLKNVEILTLYGKLSHNEQNKIFQKSSLQRIILSTNVAETSLTIPNISYVIDTGKARISRYSYKSKVQRLPIEKISKSSANQRAGRCGRVKNGICIRLYSNDDFNLLDDFCEPEILRTSLASIILQMEVLNFGDIISFPFIEKPLPKFIKDGYRLLFELNAIDENNKINKTGVTLSKIPLDVSFSKMLFSANNFNVLEEILIIVSFLSIQDPREKPEEFKNKAESMHKSLYDKNSDFITILNLWLKFLLKTKSISVKKTKEYCKSNFLSFIRMREWQDMYMQIVDICKEFKWNLKRKIDLENLDYENIHKAILSGCLGNIGFNYQNKDYLGARNIKFNIFPNSTLFKKAPKWIVAGNLLDINKLYSINNATINPKWLESLAFHLIKKNYEEPFWSSKLENVLVVEQLFLFGLLIDKRKVVYGKVDIKISRDIFIREALIYGNANSLQDKDFYKHNLSLIEEVEYLEHKARKTNILVSENDLYEFYNYIIPENIYSIILLNEWLKDLSKENLKKLYFDKNVLIKNPSYLFNENLYPDKINLSSYKINVNYNFDFASIDDGITAIIPINILWQINEKETEWLVNGMIFDKISAILKAFPKNIRKTCLPLNEYIELIYNKIKFDREKNFFGEILRIINFKNNTSFKLEDLNLGEIKEKIDIHHYMNFEIIDLNKKVLQKGRDLTKIKENLQIKKVQVEKKQLLNFDFKSNLDTSKNYTKWDFDDFKEVDNIFQMGKEIKIYPFLCDKKDYVKISTSLDLKEAKKKHFYGVLRLIILLCCENIKFFRKKFGIEILTLSSFFSKINIKNWYEDFLLSSLINSCNLERTKLIYKKEHFEIYLKKAKENIFENAKNIIKELKEIEEKYWQLDKNLSCEIKISDYEDLYNSNKEIVKFLIYENFLSEYKFKNIFRIKNILEALNLRLEKAKLKLKKDDKYLEEYDFLIEEINKSKKFNYFEKLDLEFQANELWVHYYNPSQSIKGISYKNILKKLQ